MDGSRRCRAWGSAGRRWSVGRRNVSWIGGEKIVCRGERFPQDVCLTHNLIENQPRAGGKSRLDSLRDYIGVSSSQGKGSRSLAAG